MICGLFGLPGSGKSLCLSYIAYRAIQGKSINFHGFNICSDKFSRVYTNFPCEGAYKLDFETLGRAPYKYAFMIIDEIQLFADSRNFKNFGDNLKYFFSMHRHDHITILYASQSFDNVDKRIRSLTDKLYYIDRAPFNLIRVRAILSYFDVSHGNINEGYQYCSGLNTKYFYAPRLYKYNDTWAKIGNGYIDMDEPQELWFDNSEGARVLGETLTPDGKIITVLSDNTVEEMAAN